MTMIPADMAPIDITVDSPAGYLDFNEVQAAINDFWDSEPTNAELAAWDDITGIELEERLIDEPTIVDAPWLSSLLYSDYQSADDDDDKPGMTIPRSVLDNL